MERCAGMNDYKGLVDSLRICVKYNKAVDALCNAEFAADAIEQLVRERDAAVKDLNIARSCLTCKSNSLDFCAGCDSWASKSNWEWRGVLNADS